MSRRRYISTTISTDRVVNRVAMQHGDFAALLYTWMIPHAEDDAKLSGDPEELLWMIVPGRRDRTPDDMSAALAALHDAELIAWDRDAAVVYFESESFYNYQSYIAKDKRVDNSAAFARLHSSGDSSGDQRRSAKISEEHRATAEMAALPSPSLLLSPSKETHTTYAEANASESAKIDVCELIELPETIRDDAKIWPLLTQIMGGNKRVGAIFNGAKRGNAATLRRMLVDLCGYCTEAMGALECSERQPICRSVVVETLQRIAAADEPIKLAAHLYAHGNELADYCGEQLVETVRLADKRTPAAELYRRLGAALAADPIESESDDE